VEDGLCLLEVSDVLDALDVVRCMLEAVEGEVCWLEVMEMSEVIRCVLLCMLEAVEVGLCLREMLRCRCSSAGGAGDDTLCAALYAGGCEVGRRD